MNITQHLRNEVVKNAAHIPLSGVTSYHLLSGSLSLSNSVITTGMATTLHTGNGTTQSVVTGVDMKGNGADYSALVLWSDGTTNTGDVRYFLDSSNRKIRVICLRNGVTSNPNTLLTFTLATFSDWKIESKTFGGLVWGKGRSGATDHVLTDTIRGVTNCIFASSTSTQATVASGLTAFNVDGFTVGSYGNVNTNLATYASWSFQTTHIVSGLTNHGKPYITEYNPSSGYMESKYEGSGLAGHEIPHHLGRKLSLWHIKNLSAITNWVSEAPDLTTKSSGLNLTGDFIGAVFDHFSHSDVSSLIIDVVAGASVNNTSTNQYIMYGWANSYFNVSNTLIGNYEIGIYQGTGAAGNKIATRGKPAWVMIKRLDGIGSWHIHDNIRMPANTIAADGSGVETVGTYPLSFASDSFSVITTHAEWNTLGGHYLYMVVYDNDSGSGKSKYLRATDTSALSLVAEVPFANGVDGAGTKNTMLTKNETVVGLTLTQGKNYIYSNNLGVYGVSPHAPRYGNYLTRAYAGESPDIYSPNENLWYNSSIGAELLSNPRFDIDLIGWTISNLGTGTTTWSSGTARMTRPSDGNTGRIIQMVSLVVGSRYTIDWKHSGNFVFSLGTTSGGIEVYTGNSTTMSDSTYTFIAQSTILYMAFYPQTNTVDLYLDSVTCYESDITMTTPITASRNYLDAIVYADAGGQPTYIEQLPKIEYKNIIKANEYQGKNACTAWVNFDGTTTPPTIRDSFNVSAIIRTATGTYDIYFKTPMDNVNYCISGSLNGSGFLDMGPDTYVNNRYIDKATVRGVNDVSALVNQENISTQIFGGKN